MRRSAIGLGPELTIVHAAACQWTLTAALVAHTGDLHLDLAQVGDVDSAGVQLLLAVRRSLAARGDALCIDAASAAVKDALQTFSLQHLLARPATETA